MQEENHDEHIKQNRHNGAFKAETEVPEAVQQHGNQQTVTQKRFAPHQIAAALGLLGLAKVYAHVDGKEAVAGDRQKRPYQRRAKAILRVENTTEDYVELIYELTRKLLRRAEQTTPDISGSLYALGNIDYVNLVMQNDEVSN